MFVCFLIKCHGLATAGLSTASSTYTLCGTWDRPCVVSEHLTHLFQVVYPVEGLDQRSFGQSLASISTYYTEVIDGFVFLFTCGQVIPRIKATGSAIHQTPVEKL